MTIRWWPLCGVLLASPLAAQTPSGVEPGGHQYERFVAAEVPTIIWRGWNAARTRTEFYLQLGTKPHPVYRRYPLKVTFTVDTLKVTFDTKELGENFFDAYQVVYQFPRPGRYVAELTEWYLTPSKEWDKVTRTRVIVPVRPLVSQ